MECLLALLQECKQMSLLPKALVLVGALVAFTRLIRTIRFVWGCLRPGYDLATRYGRGSWALVTGSTDGIGKAIAIGLAREGFNIVQVSRTMQKLQRVAKQLQNYKVQTKCIQCDFSKGGELLMYQNIVKECQGLDISILVNNVGADVLGKFCQLPVKDVKRVIDVNCYPATLLSHLFIPQLVARKNKSALVIVSSLAGQFPIALHNVYSASKAFTDFLARTLAYEYPMLDVLSLRPSEVQTQMTFNKDDLFTIKPDACARGMLSVLGKEVASNGHWNHKLQSMLYNALPQGLFNYGFMNWVAPQFIKKRA